MLLLLDGEPGMRHAAITELQRNIQGLTPDSLRRLIAMRNWLPGNGRAGADTVIQAACAKWAEHFAGTAQWLRKTPDGTRLPWPEFAILALALKGGCNLGRIPLMRDIAERTILAQDHPQL